MNNGFKYYRKCPLCGHMEEVTQGQPPVQQPIQRPAPIQQPIKPPEPERIENINADGGGTSAGWGK